ncbi:MAG TPA: hypothetical protein V6C72_15590 [Chroococcales cyanobacterium]
MGKKFIATRRLPKSAEERRAFYKAGLARLRKEVLQEEFGLLISDLMEIRQTGELASFATKWLAQYRNHEVAPELISTWLWNYASDEASAAARDCFDHFPEVNRLGRLVQAAVETQKRSPRLLSAIAARMESEPSSAAWEYLHPYRAPSSAAIDSLVMRWLSLNHKRENIVLTVSLIVYITRSRKVLNAIVQWVEKDGIEDHGIDLVLSHFFRCDCKIHRDFYPAAAALCRVWIESHPDHIHCGRVISDLLVMQPDVDDLRAAKLWYGFHVNKPEAGFVLHGLLAAGVHLNQPPDPDVILDSQLLLLRTEPKRRFPSLVEALIKANPSHESFTIVKDTALQTKDPRIARAALTVERDAELVDMIRELWNERDRSGVDAQLVVSMLELEPSNEEVRAAAKDWLSKNPKDELRIRLRRLLNRTEYFTPVRSLAFPSQ